MGSSMKWNCHFDKEMSLEDFMIGSWKLTSAQVAELLTNIMIEGRGQSVIEIIRIYKLARNNLGYDVDNDTTAQQP